MQVRVLISLLVTGMFLVFFSSCSVTKYHKVHKIYRSGDYARAIVEIDAMLSEEQNGYFVTLAERDRAEAYYQLGLHERTSGNPELAIRLFLLSNTDKADELIIEILATQIDNLDDHEQILSIYSYIINHLYQSPRIPEFIYKRMVLYQTMGFDNTIIWNDFRYLHENYTDSEYVSLGSAVVDTFIKNEFIDPLFASIETTNDIESIIEQLLSIRSYPTSYVKYINEKLSEIYIFIAERNIENSDFIKAESYFREALSYDQKERRYIERRLNEICDLFIDEGLVLLREKRIDESIAIFERAFLIIPDYQKAKDAIAQARQKRADIIEATRLNNEAQQLIRNRKNEEGLALLRQAYRLDPLDAYLKSINDISQIIEIEKDPHSYALKTIREFERGRIVRAVEALRDELALEYGDRLRESGFRAIRSVGTHRMEVRYDLLTPDINYYFVWRVNLIDKQVTPLNKATESLLDN